MDDIGTYQERKFPAFRNPTIDVLEHGRIHPRNSRQFPRIVVHIPLCAWQ